MGCEIIITGDAPRVRAMAMNRSGEPIMTGKFATRAEARSAAKSCVREKGNWRINLVLSADELAARAAKR